MKKLLLITIICICSTIFFSCRNEQKLTEKIEYFPDGSVKSVAQYLDSSRHGKSFEYYSNGNILSITHWKDNYLHGTAKFYDSTQKIQAIVSFKNGKRNGESIDFFSTTGFVRTKASYKDDILNGTVIQYFEEDSGKVFAKVNYLNIQDQQKEFGSVWYDSLGNMIRELRRVKIQANKDTFNISDSLILSLELRVPRFDSTMFIIGGFGEKFYPIEEGESDTLYAVNHKVQLVKKRLAKGSNYVRGKVRNIGPVRKINEKRSTFEETLPLYFEYQYFVEE